MIKQKNVIVMKTSFQIYVEFHIYQLGGIPPILL